MTRSPVWRMSRGVPSSAISMSSRPGDWSRFVAAPCQGMPLPSADGGHLKGFSGNCCISAQSSNPGEFGNATMTLLSGEEGDIESAALFVESINQLVNQSMLFGNRTLGTALTVRTTTGMHYFCHETHPSAISKMRARLL